MHQCEPLRYPPHFPPASRWKRFFIGVRKLGPDLSFYNELHAAQAARSVESLSAWGGGERQALAAAVGPILARYCNWPTPYFLPDDSFSVVTGGSTFGWLDDMDVEDAIGAIEELIEVKMRPSFWQDVHVYTLGQVVDQLASAATLPPRRR